MSAMPELQTTSEVNSIEVELLDIIPRLTPYHQKLVLDFIRTSKMPIGMRGDVLKALLDQFSFSPEELKDMEAMIEEMDNVIDHQVVDFDA